MNKKILSIILTASILLTWGVGVFAAEYVDASNGAYEAEMEVSVTNSAHYSVEIPLGISDSQDGEFAVSDMSMEDGYHVATFITNLNEYGRITAQKSNGATTEIELYVDGSNVNNAVDGKICEFRDNGRHTISAQRTGLGSTEAGRYAGIVCFKFDIEAD